MESPLLVLGSRVLLPGHWRYIKNKKVGKDLPSKHKLHIEVRKSFARQKVLNVAKRVIFIE